MYAQKDISNQVSAILWKMLKLISWLEKSYCTYLLLLLDFVRFVSLSHLNFLSNLRKIRLIVHNIMRVLYSILYKTPHNMSHES